jgi:hypothetical protein
MSLEDVRTVIEADDVAARNEAIGAHLRRMEGELEQTRATVKAVRLLLDEKAPPSVPVEYRTVGPGDALAIRERLAYADVFGWVDGAFATDSGSEAGRGADRRRRCALLERAAGGRERRDRRAPSC